MECNRGIKKLSMTSKFKDKFFGVGGKSLIDFGALAIVYNIEQTVSETEKYL